jgi:hypothetical protein
MRSQYAQRRQAANPGFYCNFRLMVRQIERNLRQARLAQKALLNAIVSPPRQPVFRQRDSSSFPR